MSKKRVLYIQHAGALGGSCRSLLYTMQALDKERFEPVLALAMPHETLIHFYQEHGFDPIPWEGITLWDHSTVAPKPLYSPFTWKHLFEVGWNWERGKVRTLELIDAVKPDIVHLNSMPLSASAKALVEASIPVVWHVREPPFLSHGIRYKIIRDIMMQVDELIFISEADRQAWVQGQRGTVIHNFIDLQEFSHCAKEGSELREAFSIPMDAPVILYVGGMSPLKGSFVLLEALANLKQEFPTLRCLMPAFTYQSSGRILSKIAHTILPKVGSGTLDQKVNDLISHFQLNDVCVQLPFQAHIAPYYAACDLLVFPALVPHFARPVIEAGAMGKPVVASRLPGITELVEDRETGLLIEPHSSNLVEAVTELLNSKDMIKKMGRQGYDNACQKFNASKQIESIQIIYSKYS